MVGKFKATETKVDPDQQFNTATATKSSILWALGTWPASRKGLGL